ncbi:uncharacterized protein K452DRAFT_16110 [Aplosporella prunicola CBS 121167]|uniref:Uncharacterized protein n=1 Tax=Aplosporella prunicola CBS 121167 TaxID=1176127 RepID=A0A6A6AWY2_9PEZI|nr:uncharacterized protein K452DRAFT_16110 [Aplosporella prunicola CBS 121167]KAF2135495.1 hypothetical protein K452DRAFT_16110 [Aplosporella prunicola CBS 121167]
MSYLVAALGNRFTHASAFFYTCFLVFDFLLFCHADLIDASDNEFMLMLMVDADSEAWGSTYFAHVYRVRATRDGGGEEEERKARTKSIGGGGGALSWMYIPCIY